MPTHPVLTPVLNALLPLLPVIIGGFIGVLGSTGSGLLLYLLKGREDRLEKRRSKLERLIALSFEIKNIPTRGYDLDKKIERQRELMVLSAEMITLSLLYFRELDNQTKSLVYASLQSLTATAVLAESSAKGAINEATRTDFDAKESQLKLVWQALTFDARAVAASLRMAEGTLTEKQLTQMRRAMANQDRGHGL